MTDQHSVRHLLAHPQLWRAGSLDHDQVDQDTLDTGYPQLNAKLWGGGWPRAGLMELLCSEVGIGELRLLAPILARLSQEQERWLVWINPPHVPYAPALTHLQVDIGKVLLVHPSKRSGHDPGKRSGKYNPGTRSGKHNPDKRSGQTEANKHRDALWALEQALKSGTASVAMAWLDERRLTEADIRRLKLAARQGNSLAILFRRDVAMRRSSMAELRIRLEAGADPDEVQLEIIKRRGGWPTEPFAIKLAHEVVALTLPAASAQLELWRRQRLSTTPLAQINGTCASSIPSGRRTAELHIH